MADATKDTKVTKTDSEKTVATKKNFDFASLNTLAVVSLASAATGFGAVAAIITGHIALAQLKTTKKSGRGLAIAGLAIGYATIAFWTLATVFNIGAFLGGYGHMGEFGDFRGFGEVRGFGEEMNGPMDW